MTKYVLKLHKPLWTNNDTNTSTSYVCAILKTNEYFNLKIKGKDKWY